MQSTKPKGKVNVRRSHGLLKRVRALQKLWLPVKASSLDDGTHYCLDIIREVIPAGDLNILAAARHLEDISRIGEDETFPYTYDVELGLETVELFEQLPHTKGAWARNDPKTGRPHRFLLSPWEHFIVLSCFGWIDVTSGLRRFAVLYIEVPRKNGKTKLAAAFAIKFVAFDNEPGAEVYCAATKKDQAKICWRAAADMIEKEPGLKSRLHVSEYTSTISHKRSGSTLLPLGRDSKTLDGLNVHAAVIDELHRHPNSGIVDVLATGSGSRDQSCRVEITTAGDSKTSICWEHHQYSKKVLEKKHIDDRWFAFIAHANAWDDPLDEETWRRANPNYGVSVYPNYIAQEFKEAEINATFFEAAKRLHLNLWGHAGGQGIPMDHWDECASPEDNLDKVVARLKRWKKRLLGETCWGGIDLASTGDITCVYLIFPQERDASGHRDFVMIPWYFCPEEAIKIRSQRDKVPYDIWCDQGLMTATPGEVTDYAVIREIISGITAKGDELDHCIFDDYDLRELAFDQWNSSYLVSQLLEDGVPMVKHRQGWVSMTGPTHEFNILIKQHRMKHLGHPITRWMAENTRFSEYSGGGIKPDRDKSEGKIDGIVAAIMGTGRAVVALGELQAPNGGGGLTVL